MSKVTTCRQPNLALFFSHGVSLETWEKQGLFDREVGYYRRLAEEIGDILFVTYDRSTTGILELQSLLPISISCNWGWLPYKVFGFLAPIIHFNRLKDYQVFKTNQISGAWTGVIAKWLLRRPLVVRCGYVASLDSKRRGVSWFRFLLTLLYERFSLSAADLILVATESDRQYLARSHHLPGSKFKILPNAIDTEVFEPVQQPPQPGLVVFIGRLSPEKNVPLLIQACQRVKGAKLWVIGTGPLEDALRAQAQNARVTFLGAVPNHQLPSLLNQAQVFVLPSAYEGLPKALLEAMACGLAVIGTNVPGIRELIHQGANGLLCEPTIESLAGAIERLLSDDTFRQSLGSRARNFILENYSLSQIVRQEASWLRELSFCQRP